MAVELSFCIYCIVVFAVLGFSTRNFAFTFLAGIVNAIFVMPLLLLAYFVNIDENKLKLAKADKIEIKYSAERNEKYVSKINFDTEVFKIVCQDTGVN